MTGKKKITIKEIAKVCGVGVGTVSRAINNQPGVKDEVRRKILCYINDIGWRRDTIMDRLASSSNGLMVVFLSSPNLFSWSTDNACMELLLEQCEQQNYETTMLLNNRTEALKRCIRMKPYAVIQMGNIDILYDQQEELIRQGVRLINIGYSEDFHGVMLHPDYFEAGKIMAQELFLAGHRKIGFMGGFGSVKNISNDNIPSLILQKLVAGIISVYPDFDISSDCVSDNYGDIKPISKFLERGEHTGWICGSQRSCTLFINAATSLNIKIPEDISLVARSPQEPFYLYPIDVSRNYYDVKGFCDKVMELLNLSEFPAQKEYTFNNEFHRGKSVRKIK